MLLCDKSNSHSVSAAIFVKDVTGIFISKLCDKSSDSMPSSGNRLSGNDFRWLCEMSTTRRSRTVLNRLDGMSARRLCANRRTCKFLVFRNESNSSSSMTLWDKSNHCNCGMLPNMSRVVFCGLEEIYKHYKHSKNNKK